MTVDLRPWRQLLPVWSPAVIVCVVSMGFFFYQTSDSVGRQATVNSKIDELAAEVDRLRVLYDLVTEDRREVEELQAGFVELNDRVFSDLDLRLTRILREVGDATREAGLLPGTFTYTAAEEERLGYVRFGIAFRVEGEYAQIRRMLAAFHASPEFLIVERLSLSKDEDLASRSLKMAVQLYTYLDEADPDRLHRLTGGIVGTTDGGETEAGADG